MQFSGSDFVWRAAFKNTSGLGFAFETSFPSTIASKKPVIFTLSKIGRAFLLADPSVINWLFWVRNSRTLSTSGNSSDVSI